MSENMGFNVTILFNLFFTDQKSPSSVYVNTKRSKTIQELKEHISNLFNVPHDDFDLYCANNFLPPKEDILVLKPDDIIVIVPNNWETKRRRKKAIIIVEPTDIENILEASIDNTKEKQPKLQSKIKRKRFIDLIDPKDDSNIKIEDTCSLKVSKIENKKPCKETIALIEPDNNNQKKSNNESELQAYNQHTPQESHEPNPKECTTVEKINFFEHLTHSTESNPEKVKYSMRRCNLAKCNSYNKKDNEQAIVAKPEDSPLRETPTFISTRKKRTSTPYLRPIGTILKELKSSSSKIDVEHTESGNAVLKKRKRYRKHKRPTVDFNMDIKESPAEPQSMPQQLHKPSVPVIRTHIKFSEDVEIISDHTLAADVERRPYAIVETEGNGANSTDSAIEVIEVTSSVGSADATERIDKLVEPNIKMTSILASPSMKNITPKAGDLIAFKMLRLTESYTPELSQYITAKTIHYDLISKSISLQIIEGGEQLKVPNGKFSLDMLEGMEEKGHLNEEIYTINWEQLIDPRLLYP